MTLAEAVKIVLQMAEAKWFRYLWFKPTAKQIQAIRIVSALVEHGKFPDGSTQK